MHLFSLPQFSTAKWSSFGRPVVRLESHLGAHRLDEWKMGNMIGDWGRSSMMGAPWRSGKSSARAWRPGGASFFVLAGPLCQWALEQAHSVRRDCVPLEGSCSSCSRRTSRGRLGGKLKAPPSIRSGLLQRGAFGDLLAVRTFDY